MTELAVFVWTRAAFAAWYVSTALLPTQYHAPLAQVPIYILNAGVIGFIWALMRQRSGSIVVTAVSHSRWNSLAYALFGAGTTVGALGIHNTAVFGPEIGLVGLGLNLAFAAVLWLGYSRSGAVKAVEVELLGNLAVGPAADHRREHLLRPARDGILRCTAGERRSRGRRLVLGAKRPP